MQQIDDPRVLIGPGDDAGVCLVGEEAIVESVDVITPVVDDPYTFGAISAANSMSDIYAMGGIPMSALAILGFSSCDYEPWVIKDILKGAVDKLREAGAFLVGGHSIEDSELKFGLSVMGRINKDRILRKGGAGPGDRLILTKPLGIGILTTALKGGAMKEEGIKEAVTWMLTLNLKASEAALRSQAHAVTDITGFGFLGHAMNMLYDSPVNFVINYKTVPVLSGVRAMIDSGMVPEGAYNNLNFLKDNVRFAEDLSEEDCLILSDPQTSGGLLIALAENEIANFEQVSKKNGLSYWIIGEVVKGEGKIIVR